MNDDDSCGVWGLQACAKFWAKHSFRAMQSSTDQLRHYLYFWYRTGSGSCPEDPAGPSQELCRPYEWTSTTCEHYFSRTLVIQININ